MVKGKLATSINNFENNTNHILGDGWNKYWSLIPPPIPIPGVAARGPKQLCCIQMI